MKRWVAGYACVWRCCCRTSGQEFVMAPGCLEFQQPPLLLNHDRRLMLSTYVKLRSDQLGLQFLAPISNEVAIARLEDAERIAVSVGIDGSTPSGRMSRATLSEISLVRNGANAAAGCVLLSDQPQGWDEGYDCELSLRELNAADEEFAELRRRRVDLRLAAWGGLQ